MQALVGLRAQTEALVSTTPQVQRGPYSAVAVAHTTERRQVGTGGGRLVILGLCVWYA